MTRLCDWINTMRQSRALERQSCLAIESLIVNPKAEVRKSYCEGFGMQGQQQEEVIRLNNFLVIPMKVSKQRYPGDHQVHPVHLSLALHQGRGYRRVCSSAGCGRSGRVGFLPKSKCGDLATFLLSSQNFLLEKISPLPIKNMVSVHYLHQSDYLQMHLSRNKSQFHSSSEPFISSSMPPIPATSRPNFSVAYKRSPL